MVKRRECSSREFPCYFFLWGYTKDPIDTIEVLKEWVENAATTIRNIQWYAGKIGKIISSAPSLLY
jgi:hypothetical protein